MIFLKYLSTVWFKGRNIGVHRLAEDVTMVRAQTADGKQFGAPRFFVNVQQAQDWFDNIHGKSTHKLANALTQLTNR